MQFEYTLRTNKRSKRVSLKITSGELFVIAPPKISSKRVEALIDEHSDWITKTLASHDHIVQKQVDLSDGSRFLFKQEDVDVVWLNNPTKNSAGILDGKLIVNSSDNTHRDVALKWLRKEAKKYISKRVMALAAAHGFEVKKVTIRNQSTRWGSCSGRGTISMNWRLIFAPQEVLDYVIVHELAHLKQMNHSQKFWDVVAAMMPEYKVHRKWLKQNGDTLKVRQ